MSVDLIGLPERGVVTSTPLTLQKTYFIVRHGRSVDNDKGERYSGTSDSPLTEVGIHQALCVARALQHSGIQTIVTSPLTRSLATAREIQRATNVSLSVDERLREMAYGDWEGLTRKEVQGEWRALYEKNLEDPASYPPPGGEGAQSVLARVVDLLHDLKTNSQYRSLSSIALVTHSTVSRIMLCHFSGTHLEKYREYHIDNASITKVVLDASSTYTIVSTNDTQHLRECDAS